MRNYSEIAKNIHILPPIMPSKVKFERTESCNSLREIAIKANNSTVYGETDYEKKHKKTYIRSRFGEILGTHSFSYDLNNGSIQGGYIYTLEKNRGKGIGEIMRLLSIMDMIANNCEKIYIKTALPSAIPFHAKYKFVPCINENRYAINTLSEITNNINVDSDLRNKAADLRNMFRNGDNIEMDDKFKEKVNTFIGEYIEKAAENWEEQGLKSPLSMVLTKEKIQENADFFNELFKKHKIDFRVDEML